MSRAPPMAAEVIVVGGGPAGSTVARLLAIAGHDVLLLDRARFPRPKACGECLNPGAVRLLRHLGVAERLEVTGPGTLAGWELGHGEGRWRVSFPPDETGWVLDRMRLDRALLEAAVEAGVRVREGIRATGVRGSATGPTVDTEHGPLRARMIIGADGLRSTVAASLGLRSARSGKASATLHLGALPLDPAVGHMRLGPGPTVGLAPLDPAGSRWTATVVHDGTDPPLDPTPGPLLRTVRTALPGTATDAIEVLDGVWTSGSFTVVVDEVALPGIRLTGDAAGYYDPLTGQGVARALRTAIWAAASALTELTGSAESREAGVARDAYRARIRGLRRSTRIQRGVEWARRRPLLLRRALPLLHGSGLLGTLVRTTGDLRWPLPPLPPSGEEDRTPSASTGIG